MKLKVITVALFAIFLVGCATKSSDELFKTGDTTSVELRSFQTRVFDTTDRKKTLRSIIATMQDLGFVISKADSEVGVVTGDKFADEHSVRLSVTVREKNDKQIAVRASAQQHLKAIEDPEIYQDFFNSLQKAMFLKAQKVD